MRLVVRAVLDLDGCEWPVDVQRKELEHFALMARDQLERWNLPADVEYVTVTTDTGMHVTSGIR